MRQQANPSELVIGEFVARLCPGVEHYTDWGPFRAIGFSDGEKLVAGVVFSQMNGFDALVSIAATSPRWATPGRIREIVKFGFEELGCIRFTAVVSKKNQRARKFVTRIGLRLEGTKWKGFDGKTDALIYGGGRRDMSKWLSTGNSRAKLQIAA